MSNGRELPNRSPSLVIDDCMLESGIVCIFTISSIENDERILLLEHWQKARQLPASCL